MFLTACAHSKSSAFSHKGTSYRIKSFKCHPFAELFSSFFFNNSNFCTRCQCTTDDVRVPSVFVCIYRYTIIRYKSTPAPHPFIPHTYCTLAPSQPSATLFVNGKVLEIVTNFSSFPLEIVFPGSLFLMAPFPPSSPPLAGYLQGDDTSFNLNPRLQLKRNHINCAF